MSENTTNTSDRSWRKGLGWIAIPFGLFAALWIVWEISASRLEDHRFPDNLTLEGRIYENEKSWGIGGPGDAETGLVLYRLSDKDAQRLARETPRLNTSDEIRAAVGRAADHRNWNTWHTTPFDPQIAGRPWNYAPQERENYDIAAALRRDGAYPIEVEPAVAKQVDRIMNSPGAFYATGAGGTLIVVAPQEKLVIYAYAG